MRILYILTSLGVGGAEKQVIDLAQRMAGKGHAVAILSLKHTEEEWPVKLPVLRLNMRKTPMGILRGLRFARGFLAVFRPDLLHSHTFPANIFARLLRLGGVSVPVLNTIHNVFEGGWHRMVIYRATDFLADKVTVVSEAAAERFRRFHAVSQSRISVLTNGIDTATFTPDRKRRKMVRRLTQVSDAFLWLAVGRLAPAKDYPNLLRAFAKVQLLHPGTQLWIAGEGDPASVLVPDSDGGSLAESPGVQFLGLRRDIAELLDASDGFVLSSAWEGMPLAVGEAMAMEKPVVATDVGGVRELVGAAGLIVPAKDSEALAAAMLKVMAMNEWERKSMCLAARERILQDFSIDAKANAWQEVYQALVPEDVP